MSGLEELRRLEAGASKRPWTPLPITARASGLRTGGVPGYAELSHEDTAFIVETRNNLLPVLDALDAVLALHQPDEQGKCAECTVAPFSVHSVRYPCPTVAAITKALEGDGHA